MDIKIEVGSLSCSIRGRGCIDLSLSWFISTNKLEKLGSNSSSHISLSRFSLNGFKTKMSSNIGSKGGLSNNLVFTYLSLDLFFLIVASRFSMNKDRLDCLNLIELYIYMTINIFLT